MAKLLLDVSCPLLGTIRPCTLPDALLGLSPWIPNSYAVSDVRAMREKRKPAKIKLLTSALLDECRLSEFLPP
jgi:hypothetical protein